MVDSSEKVAGSALFCRIEGTLSPIPTMVAPAWCAANAQRLRQRAMRLAQILVSLPLALKGEGDVQGFAHRLGWSALRGISQDRIRVIAQSYAEHVIQPRLEKKTLAHLQELRKRHAHLVLISDNIAEIMQPLADQLNADALICNHLEYRNARATGRLLEPVVHRSLSGRRLRQYAAEYQLDLLRSVALASRHEDRVMLTLMGQASVVHPDRQLRHLAKENHWPIV